MALNLEERNYNFAALNGKREILDFLFERRVKRAIPVETGLSKEVRNWFVEADLRGLTPNTNKFSAKFILN